MEKNFNQAPKRSLPPPSCAGLFPVIILLQIFFILVGVGSGKSQLMDMGQEWGRNFLLLDGISKKTIFIMIIAYAFWDSPPIKALLNGFAQRVDSPREAIVLCTLLPCLICPIDPFLGLVGGTALAMILAARNLAPLISLLCGGLSGLLLSRIGLAGIIHLQSLIKTSSQAEMTNKIVNIMRPELQFKQSEHPLLNGEFNYKIIFNSTNNLMQFILVLLLPILCYIFYRRFHKSLTHETPEVPANQALSSPPKAIQWVGHYPVMIAFLLLPILYLSLMLINNIILHQQTFMLALFILVMFLSTGDDFGLSSFIKGLATMAEWLLFIPIYAGLGGVLAKSGLVEKLFSLIQSISDSANSPLLIFLAATLLDLFMPFHPKKWAALWPAISAMHVQLHVPLERLVAAGLWGEALSSIINPFWVLPALCMAGISYRKIFPQMALTFAVVGAILSVLILVLP